MDWLRWIAVLPAALLAMVLSAFPLHFVLYQTLSGWIEPYPETPERVLLPLVGAAAFVWAGARVAPHHKTETAVALFGLWLLILGAALGFILTGGHFRGMQFSAQGSGLAPVMALLGAVLGLYVVRKQGKSEGIVDNEQDINSVRVTDGSRPNIEDELIQIEHQLEDGTISEQEAHIRLDELSSGINTRMNRIVESADPEAVKYVLAQNLEDLRIRIDRGEISPDDADAEIEVITKMMNKFNLGPDRDGRSGK